jgi:hypothetical protein
MALPTHQCSTVGVLIDFRDIEFSQVDASEIGRSVSARGVAIATEGPLERFARNMRSRPQEMFRLRLVADFAIEGGVV